MTVLDKISSALGHRDEEANVTLAQSIAENNDKAAVKELIENLVNKSKAIQHDCIKVLYELGGIKPKMIKSYLNVFLAMLSSKNNRLQWGAMYAINAISSQDPQAVYENLPTILDAADRGTVITKDHAVNILINIAAVPIYAKDAFSLLKEQLTTSPTNQLPMYAERSLRIITEENRDEFVILLSARLDEIEKENKRSRVKAVINKASK